MSSSTSMDLFGQPLRPAVGPPRVSDDGGGRGSSLRQSRGDALGSRIRPRRDGAARGRPPPGRLAVLGDARRLERFLRSEGSIGSDSARPDLVRQAISGAQPRARQRRRAGRGRIRVTEVVIPRASRRLAKGLCGGSNGEGYLWAAGSRLQRDYWTRRKRKAKATLSVRDQRSERVSNSTSTRGAIPASWPALREAARPIFAKLQIWEAKPLDASGDRW